MLFKKAGEYVFFAQCFGHHYREAIEIGLSGCDFEWVPLEEVSTQQRLVQLNLNKSYFLTYLRLYYSTLVRRNTKCISPVERKLEQALTIGPSHQTNASNTCILELDQDFSIFVPLNLRDILVGEPAESSQCLLLIIYLPTSNLEVRIVQSIYTLFRYKFRICEFNRGS